MIENVNRKKSGMATWIVIGILVWSVVSFQFLRWAPWIFQDLIRHHSHSLSQFAIYFVGPVVFASFVFPLVPVLDRVFKAPVSRSAQVGLGALTIIVLLGMVPAIGMVNTSIMHTVRGDAVIDIHWPVMVIELVAACAIAKFAQLTLIKNKRSPNTTPDGICQPADGLPKPSV